MDAPDERDAVLANLAVASLEAELESFTGEADTEIVKFWEAFGVEYPPKTGES